MEQADRRYILIWEEAWRHGGGAEISSHRIQPLLFAEQSRTNPVLLPVETTQERQVKYDVSWGEGKEKTLEKYFINSSNELVNKLKLNEVSFSLLTWQFNLLLVTAA